MKTFKLFMAITILFIATFSIAQENQKAISIANKMDYSYFFKHLSYFASDELEGRDVSSKGYQKAADYTAEEFKNIGLLPIGDNQTYFQKVPFVKAAIVTSSFQLSVQHKKRMAEGLYGENITVMLTKDAEEINEDLELVFVGYGNVFPDLNIDDYKSLDVKGKVVIVAAGAPDGVKDPRLQDPRLKASTAGDRGAKGILIFTPGQDAMQDKMFGFFHSFMGRSRLSLDDGSAVKPMINMDFVAYAKKSFINEILAVNKIKTEKTHKAMTAGKFVSKKLKSNLKFSYKTIFAKSDCNNVVALLAGTDPKLKDECIVVSAHLDHLGVGRPMYGDSIYNGMWDNATGSSSVISIANEIKAANLKTKRSLIFICYTAEEKGLLGSKYFTNSSIFKNKKVVANINIDMLGGLYETTDILPEGYSHSNISEAVDFAAEALNLTITDPTASEKKYIERSDQISLIKKGVPAINVGGGIKSVDPDINAEKKTDTWMKNTYHSPFDDLNQKYSDKAFHTYLKLYFLITYYIANEIDEVKWNKDEWVYKKYLGEKKPEGQMKP